MKSKILLFLIAMSVAYFVPGQSLDTMVLIHQKIIGKVTEVTPEIVAYKLPEDDVLHKLNKADLIRICYASGKIDEGLLTKLPTIQTPYDWSKVKIVDRPEEIQGLYKIIDILVPGSLWTEKGRNSLKMTTAMMGGNIVQVNGSSQYTTPGYVSTPIYSHSSNTSYVSQPYTRVYTRMVARVYTSQSLDTAAFKELVIDEPVLTLISHLKLRGSYRYKIRNADFAPVDFRITDYAIENGNIYINAKVPGVPITRFHVNHFDKSKIVVSYRNRNRLKYHALVLTLKKS
ncbi:hypothetical protein WSM22_29920 [Cytophagales bacterium WSM2-2]|nr:hypothetical protein WSM22_29920 [Cytophagales bacterium WSM2-2]